MPRLILVLALLFGAWLAIRWFVRTPPREVIRTLKRLGLAAAVLGLAFLAATGRLNWIVAAGAALLPLLRRSGALLRYLPFASALHARYRSARARPSSASGQQSTVETRYLRMTLDHDSGDMDGEVQDGTHEGRFLSQMRLDELLDLLDECRRDDPDSMALLEAYLDRHREGWRERTSAESGEGPVADSGGPMSEEEARAILGVEADATEDEIVQAHRRLMHKLHPDRGGSDYLAAKINQARDRLLGR